jgi:excisionase family DNA binding protein
MRQSNLRHRRYGAPGGSQTVGTAVTPSGSLTVTLKEAANYLHVHVTTLRRMIRRGVIPVVRFGRTIRVYTPVLETIEPRKRRRARPRNGGGRRGRSR